MLNRWPFYTSNNIHTFELDSFKFPGFPDICPSAMVLPGDYNIVNSDDNDSLIFKRDEGNNQIIYRLKKAELAEVAQE